MVARFMHISEPRVVLEDHSYGENNEFKSFNLIIQLDYGQVWQEDGHVPKDEALDFALCLVRNMNWKPVTDILREHNIVGFKSLSGYGSHVWQTDKQDPTAMHQSFLKTLELSIGFAPEYDPHIAATNQLERFIDGIGVKKAIADEGKYIWKNNYD